MKNTCPTFARLVAVAAWLAACSPDPELSPMEKAYGDLTPDIKNMFGEDAKLGDTQTYVNTKRSYDPALKMEPATVRGRDGKTSTKSPYC